MHWFGTVLVLSVLLQPVKSGAGVPRQEPNAATSPAHLTAEQDHQRIMDLLHITSLRRGADGDPKSPYAANYDESKANPHSKLPDPLRLDNGKKVSSANVWWNQRRAQVVEDFDREVYGRVPMNVPKVNWEVIT